MDKIYIREIIKELDKMQEYLERMGYNFRAIEIILRNYVDGKNKIKIKEVEFKELKDYKTFYKEIKGFVEESDCAYIWRDKMKSLIKRMEREGKK